MGLLATQPIGAWPAAPPLGLWPLASGWMLLWSLAAAIPIALHLWSRRRHQETPWAAMRFLEAALKRHAKRLRLEQLLLLGLRVLPLLLLGLALADPRAAWLPGAVGSAERVHRVLVIDASYSMAASASGRSPLERAKAAAREIVAASQQGDGFSLIRMCDPPELLIDSPTLDPQAVLAEIDRIEAADTKAPLVTTLAAAEQMVAQLGRQQQPWSRRQLVFFSDLTQVTWGEADSEAGRRLAERLGAQATLQLHDVGIPEPGPNLAVTRLAIAEPLPVAGGQVTIEAVVRSLGEPSSGGDTLFLSLDGQPLTSRPLRVPAGGQQQVAVRIAAPLAGDHVLEARLSEDSLPRDNLRWHSFRVRRELRVLCIAGRHGSARALALALRPDESSPLQVEIQAETALVETELSHYDCVALANIGRLGPDESRLLRRYVLGGGGLMVFLGDQVQADSYNSLLFENQAERLLPARIGALQTRRQGVDPLEHRHEIVEVFAGHQRAGLRSTPVTRYFQLGPAEDARVVLALDNGDPLLVERSAGLGRCLLLATSASPESEFVENNTPQVWSELSQWPSFVPLIQQSFRYVAGSESIRRNRQVGEPLAGSLEGVAAAEIVTPAGVRHRLELSSAGRWQFEDTRQAGVYQLQAATREETPATPLTANLDTTESELQRIDGAELPSPWQLELSADSVAPVTAASPRLFRWLLGAVFALLLAECWYSNRPEGATP